MKNKHIRLHLFSPKAGINQPNKVKIKLFNAQALDDGELSPQTPKEPPIFKVTLFLFKV
jgi:hypothetical protein